jgi:hypothetical protein
MTVTLSAEAEDVVLEKARLFKMWPDAIASALILDFAPSTPEDLAEQRQQRSEAWRLYVEKAAPLVPAWLAGYRAGWILFQHKLHIHNKQHFSHISLRRFSPQATHTQQTTLLTHITTAVFPLSRPLCGLCEKCEKSPMCALCVFSVLGRPRLRGGA